MCVHYHMDHMRAQTHTIDACVREVSAMKQVRCTADCLWTRAVWLQMGANWWSQSPTLDCCHWVHKGAGKMCMVHLQHWQCPGPMWHCLVPGVTQASADGAPQISR